MAAKRIVWGKFFNSGQSCMAPNHIFIDKEIENIFIEKLKKYIVSFLISFEVAGHFSDGFMTAVFPAEKIFTNGFKT